jgi:hypothetical protein
MAVPALGADKLEMSKADKTLALEESKGRKVLKSKH